MSHTHTQVRSKFTKLLGELHSRSLLSTSGFPISDF